MGELGMTMDVHYSSKTNEWSTPQALFEHLDNIWGFTLDPCSDGKNNKCSKYYTEEDDGLVQDWSQDVTFMNPPYGREIGKWIEKAYKESLRGGQVVCLIPSRTDTRYWHNYCMKASEIIFIKGRVKFGDGKAPAPFPSAIVVFNKGDSSRKVSAMDVIN